MEKNALSHCKRPDDKEDNSFKDVGLGITLRGCNAKTLLPTGQRSKNPRKPTGRKKIPQVTDKAPSDSEDEAPADSEPQGGGAAPAVPQAEHGKDQDQEPASAEAGSGDEHSEGETPSSPTMAQAADIFTKRYPPAQRTSTQRHPHLPSMPSISNSERHGGTSITHFPETPVATASTT